MNRPVMVRDLKNAHIERKATFLAFGIDWEDEGGDSMSQYSTAIVEYENGQIDCPYVARVRFTDTEEKL